MNFPRHFCFVLLALLGLSLSAGALDITTVDGVVYRKCEVTAVEPDALVFLHSEGSARVPYDKLPLALKTKYFDPAKVEAYHQEQQQAREAAQRAQEAAQKAREEAVEKEKRKAQDFVKETRRQAREERDGVLRDQEELREMEARPENIRNAALGVVAIVGTCLIVWFAFNKPGPILVLIGVITTIYFWNAYDITTVEKSAETGKEERVESPALVQKRRHGAAAGAVLFLVGVIVAAMDKKGKRSDGAEE